MRLPEHLDWVRRTYDHLRPKLRPGTSALINGLFEDLERLRPILDDTEQGEDRQRILAAAYHYFLKDSDLISDELTGNVGLVDDALVVKAACEELGLPPREN